MAQKLCYLLDLRDTYHWYCLIIPKYEFWLIFDLLFKLAFYLIQILKVIKELKVLLI